jgi:hypothetical protein
MFKIEQKVVFKLSSVPHPRAVYPPDGTIVIIDSVCMRFANSYCIKGYMLDKNKNYQSIRAIHLYPLNEEFADSVLAKIIKEIEHEELEMVCIGG